MKGRARRPFSSGGLRHVRGCPGCGAARAREASRRARRSTHPQGRKRPGGPAHGRMPCSDRSPLRFCSPRASHTTASADNPTYQVDATGRAAAQCLDHGPGRRVARRPRGHVWSSRGRKPHRGRARGGPQPAPHKCCRPAPPVLEFDQTGNMLARGAARARAMTGRRTSTASMSRAWLRLDRRQRHQ